MNPLGLLPGPVRGLLWAAPTPWHLTLSRAGVRGGPARADHTAAAHLVARRYPALYSLGRLILPLAWQPYAFALTAVGVHTDCLVDVPVDRRDPDRFHAWTDEVRRGMATGHADRAFLRAFLHTLAARRVPHAHVHDFLAGQAGRLTITAYATEQDHHDHIDQANMPGFRLLHAVCAPGAEPPDESLARPVVDAIQRVDDLADLSADLRRGLLSLPETDLLRFEVTRADLEAGRDTPAVRALLAHACGKARAALDAGQDALQHLDPVTRFIYRPALLGAETAMTGIERRGAALTRHGVIRCVRPSPFRVVDGALRTVQSRLSMAVEARAGEPPRVTV